VASEPAQRKQIYEKNSTRVVDDEDLILATTKVLFSQVYARPRADVFGNGLTA